MPVRPVTIAQFAFFGSGPMREFLSTAGMTAVAGQFQRLPGIFAILAAILAVLALKYDCHLESIFKLSDLLAHHAKSLATSQPVGAHK